MTKAERRDLDYYPTPGWCTRLILPHLPYARTVIDPCCGVGEILDEAVDVEGIGFGIELDPTRAELAQKHGTKRPVNPYRIIAGDARVIAWPVFDLAIFNPPFVVGASFIRHALEQRRKRATVAALLRLSFAEPCKEKETHVDRRLIFEAQPPDIFILPERPRFRGEDEGTDSVTAAWFVWGPGRTGVTRWLRRRHTVDPEYAKAKGLLDAQGNPLPW
jgi:hypothetical protein